MADAPQHQSTDLGLIIEDGGPFITTENAEAEVRWRGGKLQQLWRVSRRAFGVHELDFVWRDVPEVPDDAE
jgi:hypothetical protein